MKQLYAVVGRASLEADGQGKPSTDAPIVLRSFDPDGSTYERLSFVTKDKEWGYMFADVMRGAVLNGSESPLELTVAKLSTRGKIRFSLYRHNPLFRDRSLDLDSDDERISDFLKGYGIRMPDESH